MDEDRSSTHGRLPITVDGPATERTAGRSYVVRHWRGDLQLGVTYWVNGLVPRLLLASLVFALQLTDFMRAPRIFCGVLAAVTVFSVPLEIWQLVGTWRSAGRRITQRRAAGRRAFWPQAGRVSVLLGAIGMSFNLAAYGGQNAWANIRIAAGHDPTPHHMLRLLDEGREIEIAGGFDFGTATDFKALLDASPNVRTVDFRSGGGRVAEAGRVHDLIHDRHLATYVASMCASACTAAYIGGNPRYLGPNGKLGFHRYSFPGLTAFQDNHVNQQGRQALIDAGVTPGFVDKAFTTPSAELWTPDREMLLSSHVATELVDGSNFSAAAMWGDVTAATADQVLQASPSYAALKRVDPETYARAVEATMKAGQAGKLLRTVSDKADALLAQVYAKYVSISDNNTQVAVARLAGEEGDLC